MRRVEAGGKVQGRLQRGGSVRTARGPWLRAAALLKGAWGWPAVATQAPHFSCIFSRIGTIMSNLGRLAGSSFMQIFISLQI